MIASASTDRRTALATVVIALAIFSPPEAAAGESWRAFANSEDNVLFSVDEASLKRQGDVVSFWERLVYVVPVQQDHITGKLLKEKRVHRLMNCAQRTQGHLYGALYADDGKRIESVSIPASNTTMTPIPPETLAERELEWACAAAPKSP